MTAKNKRITLLLAYFVIVFLAFGNLLRICPNVENCSFNIILTAAGISVVVLIVVYLMFKK